MPDIPEDRVTMLRERVNRSEYRVDADAVAQAIVERLLAGRALPVPAVRGD